MFHPLIYQSAQASCQRTEDTHTRHFTPWQRGTLAFALWSGLSLTWPVQAAGWVMNVNITADEFASPGAGCSLREAIQNFEDNILSYPECGGPVGSPVTINVPAGTYPLSATAGTGYIGIGRTDSLTIQGAGASSTIIDRVSSGIRGFQVSGGVNLTLNDLTLTNGLDPGTGGGAIYTTSTGTITVNNCIFTGNRATSNATSNNGGGAIFVNSGTLTVTNTTFSNNQAVGSAGAIFLNPGTTVTINTSTFTGNRASSTGLAGDGGAIFNYQGTLTINDSTFTTNQTAMSATGQNGGALAVGANSNTTINRSTFTGNSATYGGAIFVWPSNTFSLSNSTLTGNTAGDASTAGFSSGGGIYFWTGGAVTATLKNVTVANNSISGSLGGAGLRSDASSGLSLYNSIFANNTSAGGTNNDCYLSTGTLTVNTNNLVMSGNCGTPAVTANPLLGSLASNGGTTQTLALLTGSPALEAGNDASCVSPAQNGLTRPQGVHCDIGAYEVPAYTLTLATNGSGTGTVSSSGTPVGASCGTNCLSYLATTPVTLTATADTAGGSTFAGWNCTPTFTSGSTLTANTVCTATFNPPYTFSTAVAGTGTGSITGSTANGTYPGGTVLTLVATPATSSYFVGWSPATCVTGLTLTANTTCTATFDVLPPPPPPPPATPVIPPPTYQLQLRVVGTGQGQLISNSPVGLICSSTTQPCSFPITGATWIDFTVTPNPGSELMSWSGDSNCGNGGNQILVTQDTTCTVTFGLNSYQLTANFLGKGRVTGPGIDCPGQCTATYLYGTTVTLQAQTTHQMWNFSGWQGCDSQGNIQITNDVLCQAVFTPDPNIPSIGDGNGDGLPDAYQDNVVSLPDKVKGSYLTLEAQPATCIVNEIYPDLAEAQTVKLDHNKKFVQGMLYFDLACPQAQVSIYYHGMSKVARNLKFYKFGPKVPGDLTTLAWYSLPSIKYEVVTIGGKPVVKGTYTLKDGELGDSTGVDGHIIDPIGLTE